MTRLYLVRHGSVALSETFYGHLDVPLDHTGVAQLEQVADALTDTALCAVYSSDLSRATEGAAQIARRFGLTVQPRAAFREMHLGVLEGLGWEEARRAHPELTTIRYRDMWDHRFPGGGESISDVATRVLPALEALLADHPDAAFALVAHNSVNRVILGHALGLAPGQVFGFDQDHGCVNTVVYGEHPRVVRLNWRPGL